MRTLVFILTLAAPLIAQAKPMACLKPLQLLESASSEQEEQKVFAELFSKLKPKQLQRFYDLIAGAAKFEDGLFQGMHALEVVKVLRKLQANTETWKKIKVSALRTLESLINERATQSANRKKVRKVRKELKALGESIAVHESNVNSISFSSDGRWLASADKYDQIIIITSLADRTAVKFDLGELGFNEEKVVVFVPGKERLLVGSGGNLITLEFKNGKWQQTAKQAFRSTINAIYISPAASKYAIHFIHVASYRHTEKIAVFKYGNKKPFYQYPFERNTEPHLYFTENEKPHLNFREDEKWEMLFNPASNGWLVTQFYDESSKKPIQSFDRTYEKIQPTAMFFFKKLKRLIAGAEKGQILWYDFNVRGNQKGNLITNLGDGIHKFARSPDGKTLAALSYDGRFAIIDAENLNLIWKHKAPVRGNDIEVGDIAFSPDGNTLAVGVNRKVYIYDGDQGWGEEVQP